MRGAAPARAIQELAGHQNLTTTQRYMQLSPAVRDASIDLLNDGRTGPAGREGLEKGWRRAGACPFPSGVRSGERGIRTLGTLTGTPDFESGSFGHSDSSPPRKVQKASRLVKPCSRLLGPC